MSTIVVIGLIALFTIAGMMTKHARGSRRRRRAVVTCPKCRTRNPGHAQFCAQCGDALV